MKFFFEEHYDGKPLEELFESPDVYRITKKNWLPLKLPHSDGWSKIYAPFSFQVVLDATFNCVGKIAVISEKSDVSYVEKNDSVETCLSKLARASEVCYKLPQSEGETSVSRPWQRSTSREEGERYEKFRATFYLSRPGFMGDYFPDLNHFRLSYLFFGSKGEWKKFYCSLFPCNLEDFEETSFYDKGRLVFLVEASKGTLLCYATVGGRLVYVDGHPCDVETIPRYVHDESGAKKTLFPLDVVFTNAFMEYPARTKAFSRAVSALCHLELFGQSTNERDVALKTEEFRLELQHEDSLYNLRKNPPLHWNNQRTVADERIAMPNPSSQFRVLEKSDRRGNSPFESLRWAFDSSCMIKGYAFVDQFYEKNFGSFSNRTEERKYTFLAFSYAFLSQTLSNSTFCYYDLKYRRNAPQLGAYDWWITYDGALYYRKSTESIERRKKSIEGTVCIDDGNDVVEKKEENTIDVPFFLANKKTKTDSYGRAEEIAYKNPNRSKKSNPNLTSDLSSEQPFLKTTTIDASADLNAYDGYDPQKMRKYDGMGAFPFKVDEDELNEHLSKGNVMYDSFTCEKNGIPFVLKSSCNGARGGRAPNLKTEQLVPLFDFCEFYVTSCQEELSKSTNHVTFDVPNYEFLFDFVVTALTVPGELLHVTDFVWSSNPLWLQCALYATCERKRSKTIFRIYPNIPKSLDDACFAAAYVGMWKSDRAIMLGYASEDISRFSYETFWCDMRFKDTNYVPRDANIWKMDRLSDPMPLDGKRLRQNVKMIKISVEEFDELLKRAVIFAIDDDF